MITLDNLESLAVKHLCLEDITKLCSTSRYCRQLYQRASLWSGLMRRDFPIIQLEKFNPLEYRQIYQRNYAFSNILRLNDEIGRLEANINHSLTSGPSAFLIANTIERESLYQELRTKQKQLVRYRRLESLTLSSAKAPTKKYQTYSLSSEQIGLLKHFYKVGSAYRLRDFTSKVTFLAQESKNWSVGINIGFLDCEQGKKPALLFYIDKSVRGDVELIYPWTLDKLPKPLQEEMKRKHLSKESLLASYNI